MKNMNMNGGNDSAAEGSSAESEMSTPPSLLPEKPTEPLASDCCGTGCTPCVFDLYEQEMTIWKKECQRLQEGRDISCDTQVTECMSPFQYQKFELTSITQVTPDSFCYRFRLPENASLNLQPGEHIVLRWVQESGTITRQYTPVSPVDAQGYFDVLIKLYEDGEMSKYIREWAPGDEVQWRGPFGRWKYRANSFKRIVMFAAGTGIAPMIQVIRQIIENEDDMTFVHLVYCCRHYSDILMKSQLDEWTDYWNFSVHYVLSQDTKSSCSSLRYGDHVSFGRLTEEIVQNEIGAYPDSTYVLVCGTKSFDKDVIKYIRKCQMPESQYFKF